MADLNKIDSGESYRIDKRATVKTINIPSLACDVSFNIAGGSEMTAPVQPRSNADRWPSASGTI